MLNWDDVFIAKSDVVTRESDGELVVVMPDQGKFVVLNATGSRVLQLADGQRTLRDIAQTIAAEFNADVSLVEQDVLQFAASLVERKVLVPAR